MSEVSNIKWVNVKEGDKITTNETYRINPAHFELWEESHLKSGFLLRVRPELATGIKFERVINGGYGYNKGITVSSMTPKLMTLFQVTEDRVAVKVPSTLMTQALDEVKVMAYEDEVDKSLYSLVPLEDGVFIPSRMIVDYLYNKVHVYRDITDSNNFMAICNEEVVDLAEEQLYYVQRSTVSRYVAYNMALGKVSTELYETEDDAEYSIRNLTGWVTMKATQAIEGWFLGPDDEL